jgi:hypothetical protein
VKEYKLTDKEVRWVLICLNDIHHHRLSDIVDLYNRMHPPSLLFPLPKKPIYIERILRFLTEGRTPLVKREIYTYYTEPIPPTPFYSLTAAGIQFLNARR